MKFHVLTLFPEMFESLNHSILKRANEDLLLSINTINIRDFSNNKHKKVDDYPYGGGAGMVMKAEPIISAINSLNLNSNIKVIYLTPKGKTLDQKLANKLALETDLVLICGHYEGIDQRVIDYYVSDEISIGDYVLTGGEIPAMVLIDTVSRLIDGVLSKNISYEDESHYRGLLEYSQYTRPANYNDMLVPEVLLSGNHKKIEEYRRNESLKITKKRRPDLINKSIRNKILSKKDLEFLNEL